MLPLSHVVILIVGLGNPGVKYAHTKHNAGFMCVDHIAQALVFPDFTEKHGNLISEKSINGIKIILLKPQSFMNLSGGPVQKVISFYKIPIENMFVIHDDIDLSPFNVKIKFAGSNGGHNGLRSIEGALGKDYWRIRIGVGRPDSKIEVSDYVISNFYPDELKKLQNIFEIISDHIFPLITLPEKDETISKISSEIKKENTPPK